MANVKLVHSLHGPLMNVRYNKQGLSGLWQCIHKCQTPLHGHRLRSCYTTPPTDKLTTILQLVVEQICHIAMPEPNISTCVKMLGCGKFLSVGGEFVVQQVVEFL